MAPETRLFPNDVAQLRLISDWVRAYIDGTQLPQELVHRVDLCLQETVANVMLHAYERGGPGNIAISLEKVGEGFHVTVADNGPAFDPLEYPKLVPAAKLEDAKVGGFGIHLIRSFADVVEYRREADRNILAMSFCGRR